MKENKIYAALIGLGYWGRKLYETSKETDFIFKNSYDENAGAKFDGLPKTNLDTILNDDSIKAVFIAVPPKYQYDIIKKVLEKGKNVWAEKPLTLDYVQACELAKLADRKGIILHTDHTFLYDKSYLTIKQLKQVKLFGTPKIAKLIWANYGKFQECGVIWDLAPHPLSICLDLFGFPKHVRASSRKEDDIDHVANIQLIYNDNFSIFIEISWLSPNKIRRLEILTDQGLYETNFETDIIFRKQNKTGQSIPSIKTPSSLEVEINHFLYCIKENSQTFSSGYKGADIVRIIEKINDSIINCGREQSLNL